LGEGSTFGFSIPLGDTPEMPIDRSEMSVHEAPAAGVSAEVRPVVVVIEDDRRSFDLLRVYLEGVGVRVGGAKDGEEGLDMGHRLAPSGVLLDILLPGIDGWEVLSQLKADAETASIPVIVVSMLEERGRAVALGASEYLVKPVSKAPLLAALHRAVRFADED